MNIDIAFLNSRKFLVLLFFSLFFIGLGYISLLPIFEGFDETAHYSRIREIENSASSMFERESYIDQVIIDYIGPMPYSSGSPPYSHENTYDNFFDQENLIDNYREKYINKPLDSQFHPSGEVNWQIQHPPLYYFIVSRLGIVSDKLPLASQFFALRLISYLFVLIGIFFGAKAASNIVDRHSEKNIANIRLGFLIYPLIFPMFFLEFARIGNDSLCILLVGIFAYLMSLWHKDKGRSIISISIGVTLALGLITKALFIPITAAFGIVLVLNVSGNNTHEIKSKLLKSSFLIFIPLCLIAGSYYLFKYIIVGDPGLGFEAFQLAQRGGLLNGLKEHFDFFTFLRGLIVPFATFFWAGTWSLVRMPLLSYVPLFLAAAWLIKAYIFLSKEYKVDRLTTFLIPSFFLMYLGLAWHVMIMMGLNGVATSPGWYFHILMPLIAPLVGIAYSSIIKDAFKAKFFIYILAYSFLFQLSAILFHTALFGAGAFKGDDKSFIFNQNILTIDGISSIYHNLTIVSFPNLSFISFLLGFFVMAYLIIKIQFSQKKASLFNDG
jgi:hypothetical protein